MVCLRTMCRPGERLRGKVVWFCLRPEDPIEFASLMVGAAEVAPHATVGVATGPEIVVGAMVIRLEVGATAERIASVVRALAVCP